LDLQVWQKNFEYLLEQDFINLIISSTVTPLTIKTLPDLLGRIQTWGQRRKIYHYQNSVNSPSYLEIDVFGDIFRNDFQQALELKPTVTPEEISSRDYLLGIAKQSASGAPRIAEIQKLYDFLTEIDRRRNTNWVDVFPWLQLEFDRHNIK
jgi:hypothetical protein